MKRILVTVHGIRTFGHWQSRLADLVARQAPDIDHRTHTFGYFSALAFLIPPLRWIEVRRFANALEKLMVANEGARIDIVSHSFGTHVVAWGLLEVRKRRKLNIGTVILASSVLRAGFRWDELLDDGSVGRVVNDCGIDDSILVLSQLFGIGTGIAGRFGFSGMTSDRFLNRYFKGGHSHYFLDASGNPSDAFMHRYWLPMIVTSDAPERINERSTPTPWEGMKTAILQNFEIIKLTAYAVLVLAPLATYVGLYTEAEAQRIAAIQGEQRAIAQRQQALQILEWAVSNRLMVEWDRTTLTAESADLLDGMTLRLSEMGFKGAIVLKAHLAQFCKVFKGDREVLAPASLPASKCDSRGNGSDAYAQRLAVRVAEARRAYLVSKGIDSLSIYTENSRPPRKALVPYPDPNVATAGEWNDIARRNNRIEVSLGEAIGEGTKGPIPSSSWYELAVRGLERVMQRFK